MIEKFFKKKSRILAAFLAAVLLVGTVAPSIARAINLTDEIYNDERVRKGWDKVPLVLFFHSLSKLWFYCKFEDGSLFFTLLLT